VSATILCQAKRLWNAIGRQHLPCFPPFCPIPSYQKQTMAMEVASITHLHWIENFKEAKETVGTTQFLQRGKNSLRSPSRPKTPHFLPYPIDNVSPARARIIGSIFPSDYLGRRILHASKNEMIVVSDFCSPNRCHKPSSVHVVDKSFDRIGQVKSAYRRFIFLSQAAISELVVSRLNSKHMNDSKYYA
jgi:hypothetical protein